MPGTPGQPPSNITLGPPQVDAPLAQTATYAFDQFDRAYLDSQIRGLEQIVVALLTGGLGGTFIQIVSTSAAAPPGSVVASANVAPPAATLAVEAALTNSAPIGIVLTSAAPGGYIMMATSGVVPASITGLAAGSPGFAVLDTDTGAIEVITHSPSVGQFCLGTVDSAGNLLIAFNAFANQGGGSGATDPIDFTIDTSGGTSDTSILGGSTVYRVLVKVTIAFDGGATLNIGQAGAETLLVGNASTPALDLTVVGLFPIDVLVAWGSSALAVVASVTGSPTVGAAEIFVQQGPTNS